MAHVFLRYRDGSFLTYEGPGAGTGAGQGTGTSAGIGLNPEGALAGAIIDDNNVLHGYFRKPDGTFVVINAPGAGTGPGQGTDTDGVSASYFVSGLYADSSGVLHGSFVTLMAGSLSLMFRAQARDPAKVRCRKCSTPWT